MYGYLQVTNNFVTAIVVYANFVSIYLFKLCKHLYSYPEDGFLLIRNMLKLKKIVVFIKIVLNHCIKFKNNLI